MKALIFDLDQTLVDTQHIEPLRRTRKWGSVFQKIPTIIAYEGIDDVLSVAREKGVKLAIVSSSPSNYVQKIIHHFNGHLTNSFVIMIASDTSHILILSLKY